MKYALVPIAGKENRRKGITLICIAALIMTTVFTVSAFAAPRDTSQYIGEARAKSIALEHAGLTAAQATFIKAHLDYDDGLVVYDIEFYSGNVEYDYEIDAVSGHILNYDREIEYYTIAQNSAVQPPSSPATNHQHSASHPSPAPHPNSASGTPAQNTTPVPSSSNSGQYIGEARVKAIALSAAGLAESQVHRIKVQLDREDSRMVYEIDFKCGQMEYEYEIDAITGAIYNSDVEYDD